MAYDEELAARLRSTLAGVEVREQRMFGGLAFLHGGHMAVAISGQGGLMVRVDPARSEELQSTPGVEPMEMGGRRMKGWLLVPFEAVAEDAELERWAQVGLAYAGSLPPK